MQILDEDPVPHRQRLNSDLVLHAQVLDLKLELHAQLLVEGVAEQDEVKHRAGAELLGNGQDLIIELKHPPYMIEELLESLDDFTFLVLQRDLVLSHHQGANDEAEHLDGEGLGGGNSKLRADGDVDPVMSVKALKISVISLN